MKRNIKYPRTVAILWKGEIIEHAKPVRPEHRNFVVCCHFGDWSGFRTLAECQAQYKELEDMASYHKRPDGYYWVEER